MARLSAVCILKVSFEGCKLVDTGTGRLDVWCRRTKELVVRNANEAKGTKRSSGKL
jgi:hypothetical protein